MSAPGKSVIRAAVYTRKSSEEGLEQSFNSLHAQREACEAFVASQRSEGWRILPKHYDDGGFSGGTMDRPGLHELLVDVEAKEIDTIVVYKIDRLTRSLLDFAKIMEILDRHGTSFVSVTQQFNTVTSMGRLTLNVLLSFAQFERELTGERIRDKIAASKRKGMWMGGMVPLGYDVKDRKLLANGKEAEQVRGIYEAFLKLGSVAKLKRWLDENSFKSKLRTSSMGRKSGGSQFSRGALYKLLENRLYLGEIKHRDQWYPGEHTAIVPHELWERVQAQLKQNLHGRRTGRKAQRESLLTGLLYDSEGNRFTPSHTVKGGRRYRYYVSQAVIRSGASKMQRSPTRLPAHKLEIRVRERLTSFLSSIGDVLDNLTVSNDPPAMIQQITTAAPQLAKYLGAAPVSEVRQLVESVVAKIVVYGDRLDILARKAELCSLLLEPTQPKATSSADATKWAESLLRLELSLIVHSVGKMRLVIPPKLSSPTIAPTSPALLKAIARAHSWREQIIAGKAWGRRSIAQQTGLNERYVRRILRCGFLAPDIVERILNSNCPADLNLEKFRLELPIDWAEQRKLLGFANAPGYDAACSPS